MLLQHFLENLYKVQIYKGKYSIFQLQGKRSFYAKVSPARCSARAVSEQSNKFNGEIQLPFYSIQTHLLQFDSSKCLQKEF